MTPAEALYADLRSKGIDLETDGERVRWRPAALVSPRDALLIRNNREQLVVLLRVGGSVRACPNCGRPLDSAARCPCCFDRLCNRCGRLTGSYCIRLCFMCGYLDDEESPV
ncbi:MAG: hypothetical protein J2P46_07730 [Zavarzinella sp.]|nr:hypothetical protein [Zavarzinella sp.]